MKHLACILISAWLVYAGVTPSGAQQTIQTSDIDVNACGLDVMPDDIMANAGTVRPANTAEMELPNPSIGFGLNGITDYTPEQPFIDIMKTARPWIAHVRGQWGGAGHAELSADGSLDENGWVKSIPANIDTIEALILTGMPIGAESISGRYRLTYQGTGQIEVNSMSERWHGTDGELWFEAVPGETLVGIIISQTDPQQTGDYIRNISVVKEENIAAFEAGEIFNPLWLKVIKDARLVRFMDWMGTNNSTQSEWADRPKVSDYTYSLNGAPLEIMTSLANRIGADPWFSMPHLATDEYMRCFAEGVHQTLRPDLKAHVEFSNEVWNWIFGQAKWASDNGMKRWGQDNSWLQYYAVRSVEMARIWDGVYGSAADDKLVKIISTQTAWLGLENDVLHPPLWLAENPAENVDVAGYFDAYAITGYFGHAFGDSKAPMVKEWIADSTQKAREESERLELSGAKQQEFIANHRFDAAVEMAAQDVRDGSVSGDKSGSIADYLDNLLPYQANVARSHGLDLIMYEGGTHIVGLGPVVDDDEMTAFFEALNYSPQMGDIYRELIAGWRDAGGTVFNVFVDVAGPSKWGSWGALRHLDDDNPRWDALVEFNASNPGWWEDRNAGTFIGTP